MGAAIPGGMSKPIVAVLAVLFLVWGLLVCQSAMAPCLFVDPGPYKVCVPVRGVHGSWETILVNANDPRVSK